MKKLILKKETVALLDSEKSRIRGGVGTDYGNTYDGTPPNCPMTGRCEETDFCPEPAVTHDCAPVSDNCVQPATEDQCIITL